MVQYFHRYTSPIQTNTYIVINGNRGFVVDPGGNADEIFEIFKERRARLDAILITHAHFDHIAGVAPLIQLATEYNLKKSGKLNVVSTQNGENNALNEGENSLENVVEISPKDIPLVVMHRDDLDKIGSYKNLGFSAGVKVEKFTPDLLLSGGETLYIAGLNIKVLHTPGHSKGGVCYIVENKIFVGDTIFFTSYGRTDFYDGSFKQLKNSIVNKLFALKGNYTLLSGHGEPTTLSFERVNNPILQDEDTTPVVD